MLLRNISAGLTILALVSLCTGPSIGLPQPPDDDCTDFEDCYDTAWDKYYDSAERCEDLYEAAKKLCKGLKGTAKKVCLAGAEAVRTCCYAPIIILLNSRISTCCATFVDTLGGGDCWSYNYACG